MFFPPVVSTLKSWSVCSATAPQGASTHWCWDLSWSCRKEFTVSLQSFQGLGWVSQW